MDSQQGPGFLRLALTGMATCSAGVCLAFALIGYCTRPKKTQVLSKAEIENRERRERIRDYEAKYFDELAAAKKKCDGDALTSDELSEISEKVIEEMTPLGLVRMSYDPDKETFVYYTDARNISYKVLDSVARSFCLSHNCPPLCVHYYDEFVRARKKAIEERKEAAAKSEVASASEDEGNGDGVSTEETRVFAKFKTYNSRASKPVKERARVLTEKANRFSFMGRLDERQAAIEAEERVAKPSDPALTFASFKKSKEA